MSPSPLRVLHVASGDRWGGAEAQVFTLLTHLQQQPGLEVRAVLLNDHELAHRLQASAIEVTILDENQLNGWQIMRALKTLLRSWRPDVIHTHRQKENVLTSLANRLSINVPSVRTSHGAPENAPRGLRRLHKRLFFWLDHYSGLHWQQRVIAVSSDLADKLARLFPPAHIVTIENGVDCDQIRAAVVPADLPGQADNAVHVGIVGRLDPVKRVDIFLEMAAQLKQRAPQHAWHFHIFGEGGLRDALIRQAETLGLRGAVTFHGHRTDIAACIADLDVLVMCSDHEGLPMTALESLTIGTPMVAHAVGGLVELLRDDVGGVLVQEHSASAYADATLALLTSDRSALMKRAERRVREQFSAEANALRIAALYATLSGRH